MLWIYCLCFNPRGPNPTRGGLPPLLTKRKKEMATMAKADVEFIHSVEKHLTRTRERMATSAAELFKN